MLQLLSKIREFTRLIAILTLEESILYEDFKIIINKWKIKTNGYKSTLERLMNLYLINKPELASLAYFPINQKKKNILRTSCY